MQTLIEFSESFLHFVWQHKAFELHDLATTEGAKIEILDAGRLNKHAGADFSEAKIYIDGLLWIGDVEIHLRASDWLNHGHSSDAAYERVILHVVFEADVPICYADGRQIPVFVLSGRVAKKLVINYKALINNENWVACAAHLPPNLSETERVDWLATLGMERLEAREDTIKQQLKATQNDWNELLYWGIAQALGGEVNGQAMLTLAQSLPLLTLYKHRHNLAQIEALLFGQAGLLPVPPQKDNEYLYLLQREYHYLRRKYQLKPINAAHWRFSRMRPANFPTIRIAQLAQLILQSEHLFAKLIEGKDLQRTKRLFKLKLHSYWDNRYLLVEESETVQPKTLGKSTVGLIFINAVLPLMFAYGDLRLRPALRRLAILWFLELPAENNFFIDKWLSLGVTAKNAFETQALLHLHRHYCTPRRCLECVIGCCLLQPDA
jgi:hypothetical protein